MAKRRTAPRTPVATVAASHGQFLEHSESVDSNGVLLSPELWFSLQDSTAKEPGVEVERLAVIDDPREVRVVLCRILRNFSLMLMVLVG